MAPLSTRLRCSGAGGAFSSKMSGMPWHWGRVSRVKVRHDRRFLVRQYRIHRVGVRVKVRVRVSTTQHYTWHVVMSTMVSAISSGSRRAWAA